MQKIKLCGMMKPCDIEYANRVKPDFVGFIFANTRRKISAAQAKQFREALDAEIPAVGVFVNEDISVITSLVQNGCIDLIQLHGEEDADYIRRLREVCDVPVIKAVKVQTVEQIRQAAALPVDYLLYLAEPERHLTGNCCGRPRQQPEIPQKESCSENRIS